jgi:AraC-like DNA-binding protein
MSEYIKIFTIINGIAAIHGVLLSFILWVKKRNRKANHILALMVFLFSIGMVAQAYISHRFYRVFPFPAPFLAALPFTYGPLFYLYIRALTRRRFRFTKIDILHTLPSAAALLYYSSLFIKPAGERIVFLEEIYFQQSFPSYASMVISLLQTFIYVVLCIRLLRTHSRKIKESFSALEKINLSWIRHMVFMFILIWLIVVGLQSFLPDALLREKLDDAVTYFLISMVIFTVGYRGMSQPEIFAELPEEDPISEKGKKYEGTGLSSEKSTSLKKQLLRLMKEKRPYLDSELTLGRLAEIMDVPSHQLSQVINEKMEQNFFQFINGYRVEEARRRLGHVDTGKDKLVKIAFDSGFNSLPTFNRVFKDLTGQSPSQFRDSQS